MVCKLGPQKVATYGVLGDLWWWRLMVYTGVYMLYDIYIVYVTYYVVYDINDKAICGIF